MEDENIAPEGYQFLFDGSSSTPGSVDIFHIFETQSFEEFSKEYKKAKHGYIKSKNRENKTLLEIATSDDNWDLFKLIIDSFTSDETIDDVDFITILESGNLEMIKYAVEKLDHNYLFLLYQNIHTTKEVFKYLIDRLVSRGKKLKIPGYSPLLFSCAFFSHLYYRVEYLLSIGVDVDEIGHHNDTALTYACHTGPIDTIKLLVEHGANIHHVNDHGQTALDIARENNITEVVLYLVEKGATISERSQDLGRLKWIRPRVLPPLNPRTSTSGVTIGSKLYFFGGYTYKEGESDYRNRRYTNIKTLACLDFEQYEKTCIINPNLLSFQKDYQLDSINVGNDIEVDDNKLRAFTTESDTNCIPSIVRASKPFSKENVVGYFEVRMNKLGTNRIVTVGLINEGYPLNKQHPGWRYDSYALHGDDGNAFHNTGHGGSFDTRFLEGDIIGCGINFETQEVFFTKNGEFLGVAYHGCNSTAYYAAVSFRDLGADIDINFGKRPFLFEFQVPTFTWNTVIELDDECDSMCASEDGKDLYFTDLRISRNTLLKYNIKDKEIKKFPLQLPYPSVQYNTFIHSGKMYMYFEHTRGAPIYEVDLESMNVVSLQENPMLKDIIKDKKDLYVYPHDDQCIAILIENMKIIYNPRTLQIKDIPTNTPTHFSSSNFARFNNQTIKLGGWTGNGYSNNLHILTDNTWDTAVVSGVVPKSRHNGVFCVVQTPKPIINDLGLQNVNTYAVMMFGWLGRDLADDLLLLALDKKETSEFMESYNSQEGGDIKILLKNSELQLLETITLHKIILKLRSEHFRKLIEHETESVSILVDDVESFKVLLYYFYSDHLPKVRKYQSLMQCVKKYAPEHQNRIIEMLTMNRWELKSIMNQQLGFGFNNPLASDIKFKVENSTFFAHKVIICNRSPYLRGLLWGQLVESTLPEIEITDIKERVFYYVLKYLYTNEMDWDEMGDDLEEYIIDIFVLSSRYQIKTLKSILEATIASNLTESNAASLLLLANQHESKYLLSSSISFINDHKEIVKQCPDYLMYQNQIDTIIKENT